jgi:phosphotransferase system enzyme I (PtsI)
MAWAELRGQPAAPGTAIGPLVRLAAAAAAARSREAGPPETEAAALTAAIDAAIADLAALAAQQGGAAAELVAFQMAMLEDAALRDPALAAIAQGVPAERAWAEALGAQVAEYEAAADATFRARGADLRDLAERVLRHLLGAVAAPLRVPAGAILLADDLTPSAFLETDWRGGGIALMRGSPASHVAMLARARGVPMVVGLGPVAAAAAQAALDGATGVLLLDPDAADRARLAVAPAPDGFAACHRPAVTAAGRRVAVLLNIADPRELDRLDPAICDGIGLVRTELMFAAGLPDEDTQYRAYGRILQWAAGRPVAIRTLDAGGDKPVPGLTVPGEANPFLGLRGLRLSLARPEVFAVQLRALARAAASHAASHGALKIMLPMVTVPGELAAARAMLQEAAEAVGAAAPPLGMMVEVPAAALAIDRFPADFFSIGSNDLVQYVTASARDIAAVAPLADLRNPGVLRLIAEVAAHGARTGREVSVCGDAAGDPALVPLLLEAGVSSLSMAPNAVGAVKDAIARHGAGGGFR